MSRGIDFHRDHSLWGAACFKGGSSSSSSSTTTTQQYDQRVSSAEGSVAIGSGARPIGAETGAIVVAEGAHADFVPEQAWEFGAASLDTVREAALAVVRDTSSVSRQALSLAEKALQESVQLKRDVERSEEAGLASEGLQAIKVAAPMLLLGFLLNKARLA